MYKSLLGFRHVALGSFLPIAATGHIPGPAGGLVRLLALATMAVMLVFLMAALGFAAWAVRQRPVRESRMSVSYGTVRR